MKKKKRPPTGGVGGLEWISRFPVHHLGRFVSFQLFFDFAGFLPRPRSVLVLRVCTILNLGQTAFAFLPVKVPGFLNCRCPAAGANQVLCVASSHFDFVL